MNKPDGRAAPEFPLQLVLFRLRDLCLARVDACRFGAPSHAPQLFATVVFVSKVHVLKHLPDPRAANSCMHSFPDNK